MSMPIVYILIGVIVFLIVVLLRIWWKNTSQKLEQNERFERGTLKEQEAKHLLIKWGYTIVAEQKRYFHRFKYGADDIAIPIVIDYLVSKNDKTYMVEVKSGKSAINIYNSDTRRQLLEYYHVVEADGFYLLNMEKKEMKKVVFKSNQPSTH